MCMLARVAVPPRTLPFASSLGLAFTVASSAVAAPPPSDDPPPSDAPPEAAAAGLWEVAGFVDVNYGFASTHPDNKVQRGRTVVPRSGEFSLNLVKVGIRRDARAGRLSPTFDLALHGGPAADALVVGEPTPGGDASRFAGPAVFRHIGRATVGLQTRRGTELSVGMHASPVGIDGHWTPDNWNYTAAWEADGVPYYFAGLRLHHPIGDRHSVQLWLVNGWQTLSDVNRAPAMLVGYTFAPTANIEVTELFYAGPEHADTRMAAWRLYSDTKAHYHSERFGVGALVDVGGERRFDLPHRPQMLIVTAALFTRWRVLGRRHTWDMVARPEFYWDRDGMIYGASNNLLASGTYTNSVRITDHLLLRLEYRYDHSTRPQGFFYRRDAITDTAVGLARDQHSVFLAVAGVFAHRFGRR